MWCAVAGPVSDLHAFRFPERRPWLSEQNFAVAMASLYDWDTLVFDGAANNSMPGGDFSLCSNNWPCHLKVVGPGKISASATFSVSCRDTHGCTGMEFDSVHVIGKGHADGFSLYLSGAPLQVSNSTFSGAMVTAVGAKLDLRSSTCVDCNFVLERGARLSMCLTNVLGVASSSTKPYVYLYSGTSASIKSCRFENLHSTSSGAAFFVHGSQLEVVDSTFSNCSSGGSGGAIHGEPLAILNGEMSSSVVVSSSIFLDCQAAASGGGVSAKASGTRVHVSNSSFARCRSMVRGGAIYSFDLSPLTVDAETSFIECSATEDGGAVSVVGGSLVVLKSLEFRNCTAAQGGAVSVAGGRYIVLESATFLKCTASNRGGAVFVSGGGGASASASVSRCGFWGNVAWGVGGGGGGMYLSGIRHVVGQLECHDNTAPLGGGGVLMWEGAFSTEIAGGGKDICDHESNNRAGYGPIFASTYERLELHGVPSLKSLAFAGVALTMRVSKMDHYNQTIASDSSSLMQATTSEGGARSVDPSVQLQGITVSAVQLGTATFEIAVKPTFILDTVLGTTSLLRVAMVYFEGTDAEVGGQMLSAVVEIPLSQNGSVCPQGYVLSLSGDMESASRPGQCSLCPVETYSLHPLVGASSTEDPACRRCPTGTTCLSGLIFPETGYWVNPDVARGKAAEFVPLDLVEAHFYVEEGGRRRSVVSSETKAGRVEDVKVVPEPLSLYISLCLSFSISLVQQFSYALPGLNFEIVLLHNILVFSLDDLHSNGLSFHFISSESGAL